MARLVDDRGRLFGKINIVDLIVLVLIIVLVVFFALRAGGRDVAGAAAPEKVSAKIYFMFDVADVRTAEAVAAAVGGKVEDKDGRYIGTAEKVDYVTKGPVGIGSEELELQLFLSPIYRVTVVVAAEGYLQDDGVHVGPVAARAGAKVDIVGEGWESKSSIVKTEYERAESE